MTEPTMPNAYPATLLDAPAPAPERLLEALASADLTYSVAAIDRA